MSDGRFECPNCDKAYRWQTKIAGRMVRCACGQKFRVSMSPTGSPEPDGPLIGTGVSEPASPPLSTSVPLTSSESDASAAPEPNPYELDLPGDDPIIEERQAEESASTAAFSSNGKCPLCNTLLREGAVICLNCGFNLAEGAKVQTVVEHGEPAGADAPATDGGGDGSHDTAPAMADEEQRVAARTKLQDELAADMARKHRFQVTILPLILAGIGFFFLLLNTIVLAPKAADVWGATSDNEARVAALVGSVLLFMIQLPCLFVGILVIAKLFGSAFGTLTEALKKLAVLALVGGQFDQFLGQFFVVTLGLGAIFSILFQVFVSFAVFWVVAKQLFDDLEPNETVALWLAMLLIPGFILGGLELILFG